jgi:hypothetical protein
VNNLQGYINVNPNKIRVLGVSNGAGLANRIFIENNDTAIDIVCAVVSQLNDFQYHLGSFYKPSGLTDANNLYCGYNDVASPLNTRKYLSISNVNDQTIPYQGGISNVGATFLPAETAAFNIATYKGYTGSILTSGAVIGSGFTAIAEFSYLSGDVVHLKGNANHQANETQKAYITDYFSDCDAATEIEKNDLSQIEVYPNPTTNILKIQVNEVLLGKEYAVCDKLGRNLLFGKINSKISNIDVSELSQGFYFLIIGENFNQVVKVIKE